MAWSPIWTAGSSGAWPCGRQSQEHGTLTARLPDLPVAARLRILPNHACLTGVRHQPAVRHRELHLVVTARLATSGIRSAPGSSCGVAGFSRDNCVASVTPSPPETRPAPPSRAQGGAPRAVRRSAR
ncbi:hypothetical protein [Streptomyces sp. FXY-T5]|uniref:hypothetical protein n=1 Tax=unclassified Streptomyces TaxID=2593676 RepID=UPI00359C8AD7